MTEAVLPPSTECSFLGNDENAEAAGGAEVLDRLLQSVQDASTTIATSGTQAQAPNPIFVVNIVGNMIKSE